MEGCRFLTCAGPRGVLVSRTRTRPLGMVAVVLSVPLCLACLLPLFPILDVDWNLERWVRSEEWRVVVKSCLYGMGG